MTASTQTNKVINRCTYKETSFVFKYLKKKKKVYPRSILFKNSQKIRSICLNASNKHTLTSSSIWPGLRKRKPTRIYIDKRSFSITQVKVSAVLIYDFFMIIFVCMSLGLGLLLNRDSLT